MQKIKYNVNSDVAIFSQKPCCPQEGDVEQHVLTNLHNPSKRRVENIPHDHLKTGNKHQQNDQSARQKSQEIDDMIEYCPPLFQSDHSSMPQFVLPEEPPMSINLSCQDVISRLELQLFEAGFAVPTAIQKSASLFTRRTQFPKLGAINGRILSYLFPRFFIRNSAKLFPFCW